MKIKSMLAAAPLLALIAIQPVRAAENRTPAVTAEQMMRHIRILADDSFEGRKPGTAGENKTIFYIQSEFEKIGLEPAAGTGWFQPVSLVERRPDSQSISWTQGGKTLDIPSDSFILGGNRAVETLNDAPAFFVGHGLVLPEAGIDQYDGLDVKGGIVFLLARPPRDFADAPSFSRRAEEAHRRGAAAVIGVYPESYSWENVLKYAREPEEKLYTGETPGIDGAVRGSAMAQLLQGNGDAAAMINDGGARGFRPLRLAARGTMRVGSLVRPFLSHNVVGRLRGTANKGESILYLGHWDHLGICEPDSATDRICNGAVDNASGIAMLIEVARNIAAGKRPERDILFMATTAEEMGLLGAEYFGAHPVVPAKSIVAAINVDTVAIAPKGEPVAIIGRGDAALDALVAETAQELGRTMDKDSDADAFVTRQDGWKLTQAGIPTVMIGGSFANMKTLRGFLSTHYHRPDDDLLHPIELGGATQDTDLMIALGRKLADPQRYLPSR